MTTMDFAFALLTALDNLWAQPSTEAAAIAMEALQAAIAHMQSATEDEEQLPLAFLHGAINRAFDDFEEMTTGRRPAPTIPWLS